MTDKSTPLKPELRLAKETNISTSISPLFIVASEAFTRLAEEAIKKKR